MMGASLVLAARGPGTANDLFRDHRGRGHGVKEQPSNRDGVSGFESRPGVYHCSPPSSLPVKKTAGQPLRLWVAEFSVWGRLARSEH